MSVAGRTANSIAALSRFVAKVPPLVAIAFPSAGRAILSRSFVVTGCISSQLIGGRVVVGPAIFLSANGHGQLA
jgi:hypothetical protein